MVSDFVNWYRQFKGRYVVRKRREHEYFINRYYAHLIDPFFTKIAYDLKLSPNFVTVLSALVGVSAGISFIYDYLILGAILLQLHHFLDGADGNLARLTNRCTPFGAKLDLHFDRVVRTVLLASVIYVTDVPIWVKILLVITIFMDLFVVHKYVLPFLRKHGVVRSRWKEWFLSKGIIPAFDLFFIYFLTSVFAVFNRLDLLVYIVIVGKTWDWMYRAWEVIRTKQIRNIEKAKIKD